MTASLLKRGGATLGPTIDQSRMREGATETSPRNYPGSCSQREPKRPKGDADGRSWHLGRDRLLAGAAVRSPSRVHRDLPTPRRRSSDRRWALSITVEVFVDRFGC